MECMRFFLFAAFIFSTYTMTQGGEVGVVDTKKYQAIVKDFKEESIRLVREAKEKKYKDLAFINGQFENAVRTNLRAKRDTETPGADDAMKKIGAFFSNAKEGLQSAFNNFTQSDLFKDTSQKLKEFGGTLEETGKKIGAQIEQTFKSTQTQESEGKS